MVPAHTLRRAPSDFLEVLSLDISRHDISLSPSFSQNLFAPSLRSCLFLFFFSLDFSPLLEEKTPPRGTSDVGGATVLVDGAGELVRRRTRQFLEVSQLPV